jgi:hypothetical protein
MVQFAGAESAVQLRFVPELVVPLAANPVGALGLVVQLLASVVTFTAELGPEVPLLSVASTVKLYEVEAVSPVTVNDVPVAVPIEVPFFKTV